MRILKFGGSSVATPERIKDVIQIVMQSDNLEKSNCSNKSDYYDIVIVVSAQGGVTDKLVKLCELIPIDITSCEAIIQDLERRHLDSLGFASSGSASGCNGGSNVDV